MKNTLLYKVAFIFLTLCIIAKTADTQTTDAEKFNELNVVANTANFNTILKDLSSIISKYKSGTVSLNNDDAAKNNSVCNRIAQTVVSTLCGPEADLTLTSNLSGVSYRWQVNSGTGIYTNLTDGFIYNFTTSPQMLLYHAPSSLSGYKYRCIVDGISSDIYELRFSNSWTGAVNNDWEVPNNWGCGIVPDRFTYVVIDNPTAVVNLNSNTSIRTLTLNPGTIFTVTAGFKLIIEK